MKTWVTKTGCRIIQLLPGRSNVFLLTNGAKNILVDSSLKFMWRNLKRRLNNLNIRHIDYLILTHSHFDHANNAARIKENYHALVIVHRSEAPYLTNGQMVQLHGSNIFTWFVVDFLAKKFSSRLGCESCEYDLLVDDKLDLHDLGFNGYIMHTPGHTFGSVSVIVDNEIALVGDAMVGVSPRSVFPPFFGDKQQLMQSWERLLETGCSWFLPAHGTANSRALVQRAYNKRKAQSGKLK